MSIWFYTLASLLAVSLVSFIGVLGLSLNEVKLKKLLLYLVSFSAGALLGDVFLHLIPEMAEDGFTGFMGLFILLGILIFFILEKFVFWHHSHSSHDESVHSSVYLTQIGDSLHNFLDGIIIAAAYMISVPVGVATTLAVVFHEIPQEIGNFAILVHGGWKVKKALFYNFISALFAVLGGVIVLLFLGEAVEIPVWLLSIAASSFIYLSMSDLIPEIQSEKSTKNSFFLIFAFVLGMVVMGLLLFLE